MTKFDKFFEFISTGFIYPLVLSFVSIVTVVGIYFFANIELMWLVNLCFLLTAITAVWGVLFLVALTISKIIEWREDHQWRKERPDEAAYD